MNNIVTFFLIVILLLASFQTVDSIQIFMHKYKDNPKIVLRMGVIKISTIFLALISFAYMTGLSSKIINSIIILMGVVLALFVLLIKLLIL